MSAPEREALQAAIDAQPSHFQSDGAELPA